MIRLLTPQNHVLVPLMTETQKFYRRYRNQFGPLTERIPIKPYGTDRSQPLTVMFRWECDEEYAEFILSESSEMKYPLYSQVGGISAEVSNLKIGTVYYWRVGNSEIRSFQTEPFPPRMIAVEGITNVRDLGGWSTVDGRFVRQGLLYRGSELDLRVNITDEGIRTMRDVLCIRTELDLRYPDEVRDRTESVLGSDIGYIWISIHAYIELFQFQKEIKQIFLLMADEANYPIYFHCYGGADRTGMVSLLVLALLGVSEEDIRLDYEMTTCSVFGYRSYETPYMAEFLDQLNRYPGETLQKRTESFLHDCGCTDEIFETIRKFMRT